MTMYAKYFWGFGTEVPIITFAHEGDRDSLLNKRKLGEMILFVVGDTDDAPKEYRGLILGAAEIGSEKLNAEDYIDVGSLKVSDLKENGHYRWPHAIPMERAWYFDPPAPVSILKDGLRNDAYVRAVEVSARDEQAILALNRVERTPLPELVPNSIDFSWLPTREAFVAHWQHKRPTDTQRQMLVEHFWCPDRNMRPSYLSRVMRWNGAHVANLQYGNFAKATALEMGVTIPLKHDAITLFTEIILPAGDIRWRMHSRVRAALADLGWLDSHVQEPDESDADLARTLVREGDLASRWVTSRNRAGTVRKLCLDFHKPKCKTCDLEPGNAFGVEFLNVIEVHHLDPIAASLPDRTTDPEKDCVPLCALCHRLAHAKMPRNKCRSIEEIRNIVLSSRSWTPPSGH